MNNFKNKSQSHSNYKIDDFCLDLPSDYQLKGDLAIDCEMMGLKVSRDRLCMVQIADESNKVALVHFPKAIYSSPNLKKILRDKEKIKIFHYARSDLTFIQKYLKINLQNVFCTKIASRLARTYTERHGLSDLVKEYCDYYLDKSQQSSNWGSQLLTKKQKHYAAQDVIFLHQIKNILTSELITSNRLKLAKSCFKFLQTRVELDLKGFEDIDIFSHRT